MSVTINPRCTACGACIWTCPESALLPAPHRPVVEASLCTDCLACIEICPVDAINAPGPPARFEDPGSIRTAAR